MMQKIISITLTFLLFSLTFSVKSFGEESSRLCIDTSFNATFETASYKKTKDNILVLSSGKILLADKAGDYASSTVPTLVKLTANGSIDPSFFSPTFFTTFSRIEAIAEQKDGKILVAGKFKIEIASTDDTNFRDIIRLNSDGTLDTNFDVRNIITGSGNFGIEDVAVLPNGKILAAGSININNGPWRTIVRLNIDGSLDTSFVANQNDNLFRGTNISSFAIQNDGKIIVVGDFKQFNNQEVNHIARLMPNGTTDTSFDAGVNIGSCCMWHVSIASDGSIFVAGNFAINGNERQYFAKLLPNGTLDPTFVARTNIGVRNVLEMNDGRILLNGGFSLNGSARMELALLTPEGILEQNFSYLSPALLSFSSDIVMDKKGNVLIGRRINDNAVSPPVSINEIFRLKNDCPIILNAIPPINSLLLFD